MCVDTSGKSAHLNLNLHLLVYAATKSFYAYVPVLKPNLEKPSGSNSLPVVGAPVACFIEWDGKPNFEPISSCNSRLQYIAPEDLCIVDAIPVTNYRPVTEPQPRRTLNSRYYGSCLTGNMVHVHWPHTAARTKAWLFGHRWIQSLHCI